MNDSNPLFLASFFTFPELENMKKIKVLYPWDEDHVRIDDVSLNPNSRGEPRELSINNTITVEDHSCVDILVLVAVRMVLLNEKLQLVYMYM